MLDFQDKIKPRDEVMTDRGFVIRDLSLTRKATLRIPPFTTKCKWGKGKRLNEEEGCICVRMLVIAIGL
jgi:hypothetical protein